MDRNAIKTFATWARRYLREQVTARLDQFGITVKGAEEAKPVSGGLTVAGQVLDAEDAKRYQRLQTHLEELQRQEKTLKWAVERLIDEIAYTWFNRLAALRFMEVNGYLNQRVVSSSDPSLVDPDLLRDAGSIAELETLPGLTLDTLATWRDQANRTPNPDETLYRQLLGVQCRALSESLPFLFDPQQDYLTLFLPGNLLNQDSIIRRLANDIPEEDWRDSADSENGVEIIGWLYQFYISERKDEVIGAKSKIAARDIPAATQLFTPHWIVRYMVENSLGRLWLESHPESGLRSVMKYYLESPPEEEAEDKSQESGADPTAKIQNPKSEIPTTPQELTVLDPACGSGHILVYAFDLLFEIYREQGYRERDIPTLILEHNLHGLDIDERAVQLARFAVLMKARAKNPRFFRKPEQIPRLKIMTVKSTRPLLTGRQVKAQAFPSQQATQLDLLPNTEPEQLDLAKVAAEGTDAGIFSLPQLKREDWLPLLEAFKDADNLGSLITPPKFDAMRLLDQVERLQEENPLFAADAAALEELLEQAELLRQQYWIVVANPPYMGDKSFNDVVKEFVEEKYSSAKGDFYSCYVIRNLAFCLNGGNISLITRSNWMFITSYEKLRKTILENYFLRSFLHIGRGVWGSDHGSCSFSIEKRYAFDKKGVFKKLFEKSGSVSSNKELERRFFSASPYFKKPSRFSKIPGSPLAYWASEKVQEIFGEKESLGQVAEPLQGLSTSKNDRFIRYWHEISTSQVYLNCPNLKSAKEANKKWFPIDKGGDFRKWYGNNEFVINWESDGAEIKSLKPKSVVRNPTYYFKPGITWGKVTIGSFSARKTSIGHIFSDAGMKIFYGSEQALNELLAIVNSKVAEKFLSCLSDTINFEKGDIERIPVEIQNESKCFFKSLFEISRQDWNNFEESYSFTTHPLLRHKVPSLAQAFDKWQQQAEIAFQELNRLEEENNRYWIDAYGLQDELTPEVPDDQITIRRADLQRDIKSLISYAVGCTMGRYSLNKPGLIHAGQPFDPSQHTTFPADADAILPITDQAYFDDDIVSRFVEFIKVAFSPETLTENLDFIANALTLRSDETALDRIRRYFVNEFISDHIKTYKKRPIYWLFTSGKKRAFGALVYLHRYTPETVGRIRTDYILELQVKLDKEIERVQAQADSATTTAAKRAATKRLKTLQDQQLELRDYQARVQTFGDKRIDLDLDDGVAYNYTRFKGIIYEGTDLKMKDLEKKAQWKHDLLKHQEL